MKIAVASGKGGTGKTMVSTSLAASLAPIYDVEFLDCDVEAPNAHLFLQPEIHSEQPAHIQIPIVDQDECISCSKCVDVCAFNALAILQKTILVFPQLCHGCGSCSLICPVEAISEQPRTIGKLSRGETSQGISYLMGEMTISEPMPTPIIRQLKYLSDNSSQVTILDSPPGASCSVVATLHDADFVLLVTEPTPFGLHDLKQMLGVIKQTGAPAGVIINRDGIGDRSVEAYLSGTPYPVLMKIPYQNRIAAGLAKGQILTDIIPGMKEEFRNLYGQILALLVKNGVKS